MDWLEYTLDPLGPTPPLLPSQTMTSVGTQQSNEASQYVPPGVLMLQLPVPL